MLQRKNVKIPLFGLDKLFPLLTLNLTSQWLFENFKMLKLTKQKQNYVHIQMYHTNEPLKESLNQEQIKDT